MAKNLAGTNLPAGNGGVTYPSPNEWPVTYVAISGITRGTQTKVNAPNHGITLSSNQSTPGVDFTQVNGMSQINGIFGFVTSVIDANNFIVAINSNNFSPYISGGYVNKIAGSSPIDPLTNTFA